MIGIFPTRQFKEERHIYILLQGCVTFDIP